MKIGVGFTAPEPLFMVRNGMKSLSTLVLLCFGLWVSGCAAPPKSRAPVEPRIVEHSDLLINDTLIDKKIRFLEGILTKKELSPEERESATAALHAYQQLKDLASTRLTEKDYQRLILSFFRAMSLMDEAYYGKKELSLDHAGACAPFVKKRHAIIGLYLRGDFKGVIKEVLELKQVFGRDALTLEVGLLFALSLAREGDLNQAIQVGEGIADELDRLPDGLQLRSKIAQWQLALGRKDKALQAYERLTASQDAREALVQEVSRQIRAAEKGKEMEAPVVAGTPTVSATESAWQEGGYTLGQLFQKVDSLVQAHDYSKARILVLRERIRMGEGPGNELLDRELEKIDRHEEEFQKQQQIREAYLKETHETAKRLIEEENYEAAINAFSEAEAYQKLDPESRALKDLAVESLINKERNRAAEIFLAAKKTRDLSKKRELLNSAYKILKNLIDSYPSSPLNQKLKSNIAIVENELNSLR